MPRSILGRHRYLFSYPMALGFLLSVVLLGATGASCDDTASATFRQEATSAIGEGVKTIVDGVLDGFIAAIENAGDGSSSTNSSSSAKSKK